MRAVETPLDLNNLPLEDGGKQLQTSWDTCSSAGGGFKRKKKKSGGEEEDGKVYECRFCSLKFCKSQALGGHMNRHRQERETETLNKARQLVLTNDLAPVHLAYVSNGQSVPSNRGTYHHQQPTRHQHTENAALLQRPHFRPMYPAKMFSNSPILSTSPPPPPLPAMYAYPYAFRAQANDYFVGHALSYGTAAPNEMCNNYTCIGTPVTAGQGLQNAGGDHTRDLSLLDRDEGPGY